MSVRLVNVDRNTPMLLPPDLREWVRDDDLVHFVIDALAVLVVFSARLNERGTGDEQYLSPGTSKPATRGRIKTGHSGGIS
jgi:hypothetical protein